MFMDLFTYLSIDRYRPKGAKEDQEISASNVLIAVGGRPSIPEDVPGAKEYAHTSDDLFTLPKPPGR